MKRVLMWNRARSRTCTQDCSLLWQSHPLGNIINQFMRWGPHDLL
jgi:hypothetical protein